MAKRSRVELAGTQRGARPIVLVLWMSSIVCAMGARGDDSPVIPWRSGAEVLNGTKSAPAARYAVIELAGRVTGDGRESLEQSGIQLLTYIVDDCWFARIDDGVKASAHPQIKTVSHIETAWKLHPALLRNSPPIHTLIAPRDKQGDTSVAHTRVAVYVKFFRDVDLAARGRPLVADFGGMVVGSLRVVNALTAEVPLANVHALAACDEVQWIEPAMPALGPVNDGCRELTQVNAVQAAPYHLSGAGVRVLLYDSGAADASHPDFGGRLTVHEIDEPSSHSTHVAGTLGGGGINSVTYGGQPFQWRGMAPGVAVESYQYNPTGANVILYTDPGDIESDYRDAIELLGVDLANNSLSSNVALNQFDCSLEGDYGLVPALLDGIVRGELGRPLTIVWAAGNERSRPRCGANYNTIPPPATMKNGIVVGAVRSNDDLVATFSSWGPTDDGRLRPDICAPGAELASGVTSTEVGGGYSTKVGTSMAAPAVTGICALLLEDHRRRHGATAELLPSTFKAILAHTAKDQGPYGPDYAYGYGSVRARDAVSLVRAGHYLESLIADGERAVFLVDVRGDTPELKVTLAWDDVPGVPNLTPVLINDLDLFAVSPSGEVLSPWTLNPANPGAAATQDAPDRLNTIEQLYRFQPEPGIWEIFVDAYSVPEGSQPFSLTATPNLGRCSDEGSITFGRSVYSCDNVVRVHVADCGLNQHTGLAETAMVTVASTASPEGVPLLLTEVGTSSGSFEGELQLGVDIAVSDGDVLTAQYADAAPAGQAVATADIVCTSPQITGVSSDPLAIRAVISLTTDRLARVEVRYGLTCDARDARVATPRYATSHSVLLENLEPDTVYYFTVAATDAAGNVTLADNGGMCFSFVTGLLIDYFSELFAGGQIDIENGQLLLVPDNSLSGYAAYFSRNVFRLPEDPAGATPLSLEDDDNIAVSLLPGNTVLLYGQSKSQLNIGSNGFVDFALGNTSPAAAFNQHFRAPSISALRMDLDPSLESGSGRVSWREWDDHVTVTWHEVQEWDKPDVRNTAQSRLYYDGRIEITWLTLDSGLGLSGISAGNGEPTEYRPSDLSAYPPQGLVLHPIGDQVAREGEPFVLTIGADSPRAAPSLSASGLPAFAVFHDLGGGIGRMAWNVPADLITTIRGIAFQATDGVETVTETVSLRTEIRSGAVPIATGLRIWPENPSPWTALEASYTYFDPEGRAEGDSELRWYRNGGELPVLRGQRSVDEVFTEPDDVWVFTVRPSDGTQFGTLAHSPGVTIGNPMDIDGNGRVDAVDVQRIVNAVLGIRVQAADDVDASGTVDAVDLMLVIRYALKR